MSALLTFCKRLWLDCRLFLANEIIGHVPSHLFRLWCYRRLMRARIGSGTSIFMSARFDTIGGLIIGDNSVINRQCRLDTRGGLTIGANVSISENVIILTASHDIYARDFAGTQSPVVIGDYVFIATRAMILPGVTIGHGAVVAAGAVVTKSVSDYEVVAGIPARQIGSRRSDLEYSVFYRRLLQ